MRRVLHPDQEPKLYLSYLGHKARICIWRVTMRRRHSIHHRLALVSQGRHNKSTRTHTERVGLTISISLTAVHIGTVKAADLNYQTILLISMDISPGWITCLNTCLMVLKEGHLTHILILASFIMTILRLQPTIA